MIENATNLTTQSEGTAMGYIIVLVAIGGIIVPIVYSLLFRKRIRFQEIYKKWLEPNVIKFEFDNMYDNIGFRCSQQNGQEWAMFFKAINWSRHYVIKGQILYKRAEKAVDNYNGLYKQINIELTSIVSQTIDKVDLGLSMRDSGDYDPQESIMPKRNIVYGIIDIVRSELYKEYKCKLSIEPRNGGFVLYGGYWELAKSHSEDKLKMLMRLLQPIVKKTVVKSEDIKIIGAEQKARAAIDSYNKVLVNAIMRLRLK